MEAIFAIGLLFLLFTAIAIVAGKFLIAIIFFIISIIALSVCICYVFNLN